jgi:hypothetical protein
MAIMKATLLFNTPTAGWSESYYRNIGVSENIGAIANTLAAARRLLLGDLVSIVGFRTQNLSIRGSTALFPTPLKGTITGQADTPWQSLLVQASQGGQNKRNLILRGLPDNCIANGVYDPSYLFLTNLQTFFGVLKSYNFGTLTQVSSGPLDFVTVDATGLVTFPADPAWTDGQKAKFYRSVDSQGVTLTGIYTSLQTGTATTRKLKQWAPGRLATNGQIIGLFPVLQAWNTLTALRAVKRNVGRPFGLQRGRRKTRPKR